jgi:hypothetical protein
LKEFVQTWQSVDRLAQPSPITVPGSALPPIAIMLCCKCTTPIVAASSPGWLKPVAHLGRPSLLRPLARLPHKQQKHSGHRLVAAAQQVNDKRAPPSAAAPLPPEKATSAAPHMECIGTGMEASCTIMTEGPEHVAVASPEEEAQAMLEAEQHIPHSGEACCSPADGCV